MARVTKHKSKTTVSKKSVKRPSQQRGSSSRTNGRSSNRSKNTSSRMAQSKVVRRRNSSTTQQHSRSRNKAQKKGGRGVLRQVQDRVFEKGSFLNTGQIDSTLLALIIVTMLFGLVMLSSASSVQGYQEYQDSYYFLKHQILYGVFLGGLAFYIMSTINYHYWRKYAFAIVVASLILVVAVFIPGIGLELLGAKRWIVVGGFSLQPSELVKVGFLIYLAAWLEKRGRDVEDTHYGFIPFMIMLGILVLLIAIAQKDLGTTIVIGVISVVVYFVAGAPIKHLGAMFGGGIAAFLLLVAIAPYRINRIKAFLDPGSDPQGIGYHVTQSLLAVGSGGFLGVGLGHSRQKFNYLPEVATDSIFAIVAEELGFLFAAGIVLLFLAITMRALHIAKHAPDQFGKLLAVGIATWIGFQAFVNIGAMLSLMPLTGITLPFISYGSSSLITLMAAVGILANISRKTT